MTQQTASLSLGILQSAVAGNAAAIRLVSKLEPAGGPGDKVFPPTYSGGVYATETRRINGQDVPCVLLDSVQSQANRLEEALLHAYADEKAKMRIPLIVVEFSQFPDVQRITALDAPHRIADAIFRDSLLNSTPFRDSPEGRAFEGSNTRNATGIFETCPTALIFGTWDSTGAKGGLGNKFARALVSEIVGIQAANGVRTGSRLDPLKIEKCDVYEDKNGEWTIDIAKAKKDDKGEPVKYGKNKDTKGKPSAINHGNVTPDIVRDERGQPIGGGVTLDYAIQTTVLSLGGLRKLRFPDSKGQSTTDRDNAARTVLAALALAAVAHRQEEGQDLRSRCVLVPADDGVFEIVTSKTQVTKFTLTAAESAAIFQQAVNAAKEAKLPWREKPITLTPKPALVQLVQKSREMVSVTEDK